MRLSDAERVVLRAACLEHGVWSVARMAKVCAGDLVPHSTGFDRAVRNAIRRPVAAGVLVRMGGGEYMLAPLLYVTLGGAASHRGVFASRLAAQRVSVGWSQGELADAAGMSRARVSHLETGRRRPNIVELLGLAHALGVGWRELADPGGL